MARYKSKPNFIEASQWFPPDHAQHKPIAGVQVGAGTASGFAVGERRYYVTTIHGQATEVAAEDWIITEPDGVHHYPCKPDIFAARYEPAPRLVMVCGVDCHPGDSVCNNYCNIAPQKGLMAAAPPPGPDASKQ